MGNAEAKGENVMLKSNYISLIEIINHPSNVIIPDCETSENPNEKCHLVEI